ncbi:hypothetical protein GCM10029963_67370 [Micromonospora andamanensis]
MRHPESVPDLVTLHVWRIAPAAVGRALTRMAVDPRRLRALPGVRFGKLLGTGTGTGFGPGDADLTRWAALTVWDSPPQPTGSPTRRWRGPGPVSPARASDSTCGH